MDLKKKIQDIKSGGFLLPDSNLSTVSMKEILHYYKPSLYSFLVLKDGIFPFSIQLPSCFVTRRNIVWLEGNANNSTSDVHC